MEDAVYEVAVPKDLADLIPDFLAHRKNDVGSLREALADADVEKLRAVAHRMKGIGSSYGFHDITALGRQLEEAAKSGALPAVAGLLDAYEAYLANVSVVFV